MTVRTRIRPLALAAVALVVAGCQTRQPADRAAVEIRGSQPAAAAAPTAPAPDPTVPLATDAGGDIVSYDSYQAAVARDGDTVASVAQRIGLSASELAAYNGLTAAHPLRAGDELVLPPRPGGYGGTQVQPLGAGTMAETGGEIEAAPLDGSGAMPAPATAEGTGAAGDAWSPELAAAAIERSTGIDANGNLAEPPSAAEPLPADPKAAGELESPELRQYQTVTPQARPAVTPTQPGAAVESAAEAEMAATSPTPDTSGGGPRLIRPVRGTVVVGFNQGAGHARNDGIDFAAPGGSPVLAAADGEVALVSQSLGGLGTIVLVRHGGDWLTVYGRIEGVTVKKGQLVRQGQKIGIVAPTTKPRMHFEVRRGAESMDPEPFFRG